MHRNIKQVGNIHNLFHYRVFAKICINKFILPTKQWLIMGKIYHTGNHLQVVWYPHELEGGKEAGYDMSERWYHEMEKLSPEPTTVTLGLH